MAGTTRTLVSRQDLERLVVQKSAKILEARDLGEAGREGEAREAYAVAARLEERVASVLREAGRVDDFAIALVSAASCWKKAGNNERSRVLFERASLLDVTNRFREKIERLIDTSSSISDRLDNNVPIRAVRLLLLIKYCSDEPEGPAVVHGLTRVAKLDFFLRYPVHLARAIQVVERDPALRQAFLSRIPADDSQTAMSRVMVRHHYGPWDHNYYNVFAYLSAKGLLSVEREKRTYVFRLQPKGYEAVKRIEESERFTDYAQIARVLSEVFGDFLGNHLKQFIYDHFSEIARAKLGEQIWDH